MEDRGVLAKPYPKVILSNDSVEANDVLGKTAYYDPQQLCITLFIKSRHPKDILRSYAHELIHHDQNLNGEMTPDKVGEGGNDPKYTQNNPHLRKLEKDAYLRGNMMFRDWTDNKKYGK